jgi:ligand-binding sensor domain-containing protein
LTQLSVKNHVTCPCKSIPKTPDGFISGTHSKITNDTNGPNFTNYSCHSLSSRNSCLILFSYLFSLEATMRKLLLAFMVMFFCMYAGVWAEETGQVVAPLGNDTRQTDPTRANRVLSLDGDGDYVRIPSAPELQGGENVVKTIEAWFMPKGVSFPVVGKRLDDMDKDWGMLLNKDGQIQFGSEIRGTNYGLPSPPGLVLMNRWYHVAVIINRPEHLLRLYLNGVLVAEDPNMGNESAITEAPVEIGAYSYIPNFAEGYMDEVRVWNVARTEEQIRDTMLKRLPGDEPGLVGYWQFEGEGEKVIDSTGNGHHGEMVSDAKRVAMELPTRVQRIPKPVLLSGLVTDEAGGVIPNASVRLEQDGEEIAHTTTDNSGSYALGIYPVRGLYDISATSGDLGDWQLGIQLDEGERRTLNLTLKEAISIEGKLLMLDHKTPHALAPVQAIRSSRGVTMEDSPHSSRGVTMGDFPHSSRGMGDFPHSSRGMGDFPHKVVATVRSWYTGTFQFINLKPGRYQLRCQILGGYVYYRDTDDALRFTFYDSQTAESSVGEEMREMLQVERGKTLEDIDFHFPAFKKGTWRTYTTLDGLVHNIVFDICGEPNGVLWFATWGGLSRYDGKGFVNFTTKDGLAHDMVLTIHRDPDGVMWFGTWDGVSRYDGKEFSNITTEDGLADNAVPAICRDLDGNLWFGTWAHGVSRYDGKEFVTFTTEDGLAHNKIRFGAIYCDPDGVLWIGTEGGLSRYDGKEFTNFTTEDGLANNWVNTICRAPDGDLWIGGRGSPCVSISRYDGKEFTPFTAEGGVNVDSFVSAMYFDPDGVMWFGTEWLGASRYDGRGMGDFPHFVNFAPDDGLANEWVYAIYGTPDGEIWFGTENGVSRYNAEEFVNFTTKDGLPSNQVNAIRRDSDGAMWIATRWGLSRYNDRGVTMGDSPHFVSLFPKKKLSQNQFGTIYREPDGTMWFGTTSWGLLRYDGEQFVDFTVENGLSDNMVNAICRAPDGAMWFGTGLVRRPAGATRYDGKDAVIFRAEDGLADGWVLSLCADRDGTMWVGTVSGLSRYDGEKFLEPITTEDGLVNNPVSAIHQDPDGVMWFGTWGGISRYDGTDFINFTTRDGLAHDYINTIYRSPDGFLWFGTDGGGAAMYDGTAWSFLDTRDGLAGNNVKAIDQDPDGSMWFGTHGGLTHYHRNLTPPEVRIASVTADQTYTDLSTVPAFDIGTRVTIRYDAMDFKTIPEKRQYRYRIYETRDMRHETGDIRLETSDLRPSSLKSQVSSLEKSQVSSLAYNPPTKETSFDWIPRKPGTYTFEVQAIDRDLNYSDPDSLEIRILPPPFYARAGFIIGAILAAFCIPTAIYSVLLTRQKKPAFEPIPNPYIVGNPIRSREMFFGRESDFEFVRAKLAGGQAGLVIVFAGERRSGKTSILFQILNGALGEQFAPVLLDMQAMAVDSEAEFLGKMASEINEALIRAEMNPAPAEFREGNPIRAFEQFMAQVMEVLGDKALLLLFDEYELIESKIDDGTLRPEFITFFASLLEAHSRLSFIFTGSRHLEQRNVAYWRVLIGKSLYRRISFLSERDALRLITEPVKDQVVYPRGIPERITRLTAGQPFYTQVSKSDGQTERSAAQPRAPGGCRCSSSGIVRQPTPSDDLLLG